MWQSDLSGEIERATFRTDLEAALKLLTDRQRTVFVLDWQGYTQAEIARRLVVDQSTVARDCEAAKASLRNSLQEYA